MGRVCSYFQMVIQECGSFREE